MLPKDLDWARWYKDVHTGVGHLERAYSPSRLLDVLQEYFPRGSNARILELGCAPGRWLAWLQQRVGVQPFGVELDEAGVRLTRKLYPRLAVARADALALPFDAESFDGVYSIGLIEHFADPTPILREACRVLRRGGVSIWEVPNLGRGALCRWHWQRSKRFQYEAHRAYELSELSDVVRRSGFHVDRAFHTGLYVPHLQRVLGLLPFKRLLSRFEEPWLAAFQVVVARPNYALSEPPSARATRSRQE